MSDGVLPFDALEATPNHSTWREADGKRYSVIEAWPFNATRSNWVYRPTRSRMYKRNAGWLGIIGACVRYA